MEHPRVGEWLGAGARRDGDTLDACAVRYIASTSAPSLSLTSSREPAMRAWPASPTSLQATLARVAILAEHRRQPAPPAIAGTMLISSPLFSFVSSPSRNRMSSSPT